MSDETKLDLSRRRKGKSTQQEKKRKTFMQLRRGELQIYTQSKIV